MSKLKFTTTTKIHYFFVEGDTFHNLIMCKHKQLLFKKIQEYLVNWYHTYILHTGLEKMEEMIRQHLYWPVIR